MTAAAWYRGFCFALIEKLCPSRSSTIVRAKRIACLSPSMHQKARRKDLAPETGSLTDTRGWIEPIRQPFSAKGARIVEDNAPLVCRTVLLFCQNVWTWERFRATFSIWSSGVAMSTRSVGGNSPLCLEVSVKQGAAGKLAWG